MVYQKKEKSSFIHNIRHYCIYNSFSYFANGNIMGYDGWML